MRTVTAAAALFLFAGPAAAQVLYATPGATYRQDFNTLAGQGDERMFRDNATLPGWYARNNHSTPVSATPLVYDTPYRVSNGDGQPFTGAVYSFGTDGGTDRALGSVASDATGTVHFGLRVRNGTGGRLTQVMLSLTGEQWRDSGAAAEHTVTFAWGVFPAGGGGLLGGGYQELGSLALTTPTSPGGAPRGLDGNHPSHQVAFRQVPIAVTWDPGQDLWLRWSDGDNIGFDHGMAVDDLTFTAVPEPSAGLLALPGLAFAIVARRRFRL